MNNLNICKEKLIRLKKIKTFSKLILLYHVYRSVAYKSLFFSNKFPLTTLSVQVCESLGLKIKIPEVFITKKKKHESRKSPILPTAYIYIYIYIIIYIFASPVKCVFEPSREEKSKTINARRKIKTVLKSALNSAQIYEEIFSIF